MTDKMSPLERAKEYEEIDRKNARNRQRYVELADIADLLPPEPPELQEINQLIYESTVLAESCPAFATARSIALHRPVLPLEPGGTKPMVQPRNATQDLRTLMDWWAQWPLANTGVLAGRLGRLIALGVETEAVGNLHELATIRYRDDDTDQTFSEIQDLSAAVITIGQVKQGPRIRSFGPLWGKRANEDAMRRLHEEAHERNIAGYYMLWSYPSAESNCDIYDYKGRELAPGVVLQSEGTVIPVAGRLTDSYLISGLHAEPPRVPAWFERKYGRARK
jgi:hypothetical protein